MTGATHQVIIPRFGRMLIRIALMFGCALAGAFCMPVSAIAVNVTVNAGQDLAVMPSVGLGVGASVYEGMFANSSTPGLLQEAGVSAIRYPGGGYADAFHFSASNDEIGSSNGYGMSPWWGSSNSYGYMGYASDFGSFAKGLLQNSGAQGVITVNYGAGLQWNSTKTKLVAPSSGASPNEAAA